MKFRIGAAVAVGVLLIGVLGWPLVAPAEPFGVVSVFAGDTSFGEAMIIFILVFVTGLAAYFVSWPWGKEIGVLAVPAGLSVWAVRSGSMASLMLRNTAVQQRQELFAVLKWEPFFWLAVVGVGLAAVAAGEKISQWKSSPDKTPEKTPPTLTTYLNVVVVVIGSGLIAQFGIRILAQDIRALDSKLGSVMSQPAVGQIALAVLVSFGLAAFVVKKFLDSGYIWPMLASGFLTAFGVFIYAKGEILQHVAEQWPAVFFSNSILAILPVQMVAFGTLGAVCGYWIAVNYNYYHEHKA